MAAPTTPDEAVQQAILSPKSQTDDAGRNITSHGLKELQDARDREDAATAAARPRRGLRFTQLVPPGAG